MVHQSNSNRYDCILNYFPLKCSIPLRNTLWNEWMLHGVFKHDELAYSCQTASKIDFLIIVGELRLFTGHETVNLVRLKNPTDPKLLDGSIYYMCLDIWKSRVQQQCSTVCDLYIKHFVTVPNKVSSQGVFNLYAKVTFYLIWHLMRINFGPRSQAFIPKMRQIYVCLSVPGTLSFHPAPSIPHP